MELGVSVERLGANGPELLDMLLRNVWESRLIAPDAPHNTTGALLISADLCTQGRGILRVYEDFSHLLGLPTWNPARGMDPLQVPNPANQILAKYEIDTAQDFSQPLSGEMIEELKREVRSAVGTVADSFSDEEISRRDYGPR